MRYPEKWQYFGLSFNKYESSVNVFVAMIMHGYSTQSKFNSLYFVAVMRHIQKVSCCAAVFIASFEIEM